MKRLYRRCAGLDVHQRSISACLYLHAAGAKDPVIEKAVFGTVTAELVRLRDWLRQHKVKHVAMESTGVYWIPVWNVLERSQRNFDLWLVNPRDVRAIAGRKTDQQDCDRIAELLQHGLLRRSFVPPPEQREWRELTRRRVQLQRDRNRVINRIVRLLETANLKLASVVSNVVGKTGLSILRQLARGVTHHQRLAELAQGSLKHKKAALAAALNGIVTERFRWLLAQLLEDLAALDQRLQQLDQRLEERFQPHADLVARLCTIPGVDKLTAWTLLAELGTDMSVFPSAHHAASWAGLCPGNNESAGKRHSGRTRKGDRYLRRILVQNAWAVTHKKNCFLTALFFRIASRRGMKRAAMAVAHRVLTIAYYIVRDGTVYHEIGGDYYDRLRPEQTARRLTQRLERIGFDVALTPRTPPPVDKPEPAAYLPKRGRPCLCHQNGIPCKHGRPAPPHSVPRRSPKAPSTPHPVCPKCHAWGIPCIHARNANRHFSESQDTEDSTT